MLTFVAHGKLGGFTKQLSFHRPCEISNLQAPPSSMENMLITRTDTEDIYNPAWLPRTETQDTITKQM